MKEKQFFAALRKIKGWELQRGRGYVRRYPPGQGEECPITAVANVRPNARHWRTSEFSIAAARLRLGKHLRDRVLVCADGCLDPKYAEFRAKLLRACGLKERKD
jgi:hypothetical protein